MTAAPAPTQPGARHRPTYAGKESEALTPAAPAGQQRRRPQAGAPTVPQRSYDGPPASWLLVPIAAAAEASQVHAPATAATAYAELGRDAWTRAVTAFRAGIARMSAPPVWRSFGNSRSYIDADTQTLILAHAQEAGHASDVAPLFALARRGPPASAAGSPLATSLVPQVGDRVNIDASGTQPLVVTSADRGWITVAGCPVPLPLAAAMIVARAPAANTVLGAATMPPRPLTATSD